MIHKMEWQDRLADRDDGTSAALIVVTCAVVAFTIALATITESVRWFGIPFACAAALMLHASFHAGSVKRETPMACAGFVLGVFSLLVAGVI